MNINKIIISNSIKALEQGAFQEFCKEFLLIYRNDLNGLIRFGATAEGRTRKGTTDFIKYNEDETTTCVQCSIDKNYWKKPKKDFNKWKPIIDINKCTNEVNDINEIILCNSKELPTDNPNIISDITNNFKEKKIKITLTILPTFEDEISNNIKKYILIIKHFFPKVYEYIEILKERNIYKTIIELTKEFTSPTTNIERIVNNNISNGSDLDIDAVKIDLSNFEGSLFNIKEFIKNNIIKRSSVKEFFDNNKSSNIHNIFGVPKIGKTYWVSNLCENYEKIDYIISWFISPIMVEEQLEFINDIKKEICENIFTKEISNEIIKKRFSIFSIENYINQIQDKPIVLILDDIDYIDNGIVKEIINFIIILFQNLKSFLVFLISNKKVEYNSNINYFKCPIWNRNELTKLIEKNIKENIYEDDYFKNLENFSLGHPVIALALARKCKNKDNLLKIYIKREKALIDEELTKEIKDFLFKEILHDIDYKNFVIRLSCLFSRFIVDHAEFLCKKIEPTINTPIKLIVENLKDNVIEGEDGIGYTVSSIYKSIAQDCLTETSKNEIYNKYSKYLLKPINNILSLNNVLDSIIYAFLSSDLELAFNNIIFLLYNIEKDHVEDQIISKIIDRIKFIEEIVFPKELTQNFLYYQILSILSIFYRRLNNFKKEYLVLYILFQNPLQESDITNKYNVNVKKFYTSNVIFLLFNLLSDLNFVGFLGLLDEIDFNMLDLNLFLESIDDKFIDKSIYESKIQNIPLNFIISLINILNNSNSKITSILLRLFIGIGIKINNIGNLNILKSIFNSVSKKIKNKQFLNLLYLFSKAYYSFEKGMKSEALFICNDIHKLCENKNFRDLIIFQQLYLLKGDIFYKMKEYKYSKEEFLNCNKYSENDCFECAYSIYRIGICDDNFQNKIDNLSQAIIKFEKLNLKFFKSKAEGELAVTYYSYNEKTKGFDIFVNIVDEFFVNNNIEYESAIAVFINLLQYIIEDLSKNRIIIENELTKKLQMKSGIFDYATKFAHLLGGSCSLYFEISNIYLIFQNFYKHKEYLYKSVTGAIKTSEDIISKIMSGLFIIHYKYKDNDTNLIDEVITTIIDTKSLSKDYDIKNEEVEKIIFDFYKKNYISEDMYLKLKH